MQTQKKKQLTPRQKQMIFRKIVKEVCLVIGTVIYFYGLLFSLSIIAIILG